MMANLVALLSLIGLTQFEQRDLATQLELQLEQYSESIIVCMLLK